jgi:hypothetical protein
MAKISKNQRTSRGGKGGKKMAKIVVAEKKPNGQYSFRQRMILLDNLQEEIKAANT